MLNQSITFEQPVNELIRVCLRVEHLLSIMQQGLRGAQLYDSRMTISALGDLLSLTDRPDLRGKFVKEFFRQQANLQRFLNHEHIDQVKLHAALAELDNILAILQSQNGKFGVNLRSNEFLTSVRQHLSIAGGALSFDIPAFHYWLQQHPLKERHATLLTWLGECEDLFQVVSLLLRLVRQSAQPVLHTAHAGFYQTSLDPQIPYQLIRVSIANTLNLYPEISVGRHGVSVRFYHPSIRERARPYEKDVSFRLSCCTI